MRRYVIISVLVIVSTFLVHSWLISIGLFPTEASAQSIPIDQLFHVHLWMISPCEGVACCANTAFVISNVSNIIKTTLKLRGFFISGLFTR